MIGQSLGISINFEWFNIRQNSTYSKIGKPRKLYRNTRKSEAGSNEPITMLSTSFLKNDITLKEKQISRSSLSVMR